MTNPLKTVRTYLVTRRQIRKREADLNRELADYNTPSARMDMEAILARHPSHEAREIEAILRRHALSGMLRNHS
ncbi:hypothetical protein F4560_008054 [Saccharothrix ecbatanensis]|uniref:Uncharacterized protein n=1 Tax=Saccharothrix ecbatanensis TaxID=1105145 RepID=A0A7W9M5K2_9PSEU|nr:hypothetical protein [Saccharothrix ecbatanensis]MBB5808286.1 hypothetical protein [Saccharothrix ecbatanensis]